MPNTVFVGGIDIRMDETEIRSFFARYGTVKEVKIITDRTGLSCTTFLNLNFKKFMEKYISELKQNLNFGPKLLLNRFGSSFLCLSKLGAYHVQPRHLGFNPPVPQFHSVWSNQNTETYMPPPAMMSPVTQYVQAYPYGSQAVLIQQQVPVGYQPAYNYQVPPQWPPGEQRNYIIPPAYTPVNYHCSEVEPEVIQAECSVPEPAQPSGNSPQKKSVDRSIQTVVSCLFNPENRLRNNLVSQEDYFKEKRVHHFRRSRTVLKSV
uniref:Deleted in azoospermia-like n=1 Tax=Gopherus evgoodei TaxID=1825980 RepID=A0A8C4Y0Z0_9SAUR